MIIIVALVCVVILYVLLGLVSPRYKGKNDLNSGQDYYSQLEQEKRENERL